MTAGHGNHYDVDGQSLDERWPNADAVAAVGGPVREPLTDGGCITEDDIDQRLARLERIVFDDQEGDDAE
ncbi:hypothetical protein [Haloarcula marismortui]|uniref:Uncharacterized protein n=1 Tax=Haloarcula marismortui ATCC 33800 TaxID=662476 RepID=M0JIG1_9EURY|nr:hypothetical protein [Haloarcula sinaiiensis]EMA08143.1 hypothetical protein C436_20633 [Haloarcula sinaiiensis ATCC 33800]QUJ73991.1 hypothetical protein KDQ40_18655 [Haloarcula sinaiiensis ATCC 33800]